LHSLYNELACETSKEYPQRHSLRFASFVAAGSSVVTLLLAMTLNLDPGGVFAQHADIAKWILGGPKPEVVTWPIWGYASMLALVQDYTVLILLQWLLSIVVLGFLTWKLAGSQNHIKLIVIMMILAIPWHMLQLMLYPHGMAGSFCVAGLLALEHCISSKVSVWGVIAGILFGLSQNLRSEFLLLPLFLLVVQLTLTRINLTGRVPTKPFAICILTALAIQVPWAWFYHSQTGKWSLSESNLGHVLYVSMGAHPRNPWGVYNDDRAAQEAVERAGSQHRSLSEEGNTLLFRTVASMALQHPLAVIQRTVVQAWSTLLAPFYWGEPRLAENSRRDLDVLRETVKGALGAGVTEGNLMSMLQMAANRTLCVISLQFRPSFTNSLQPS
jgi:hypothetical protein